MPADIRVPIPRPSEDLRLYFDELVDNDGFGLALDTSVSEFDELAQVTDLSVTAVDVSGAGIAVHYTVSWRAFHACDDQAIGGDNARLVLGKLDGVHWLFEKAPPLPVRSTLDEF